MKTKGEIREKIRQFRIFRNDAQQLEGAEGYVFLCNGAIKAMEWVLDYKRKPQFWCCRCTLLHNNLKCPKCGGGRERKLEDIISNKEASDIEL